MLEVVRLIESADIAIVGLSVHDSVDHAVTRLILNDADAARRALDDSDLPTREAEVVAVEAPEGRRPILRICSTLLRAELNIEYAYPVVVADKQYGLAMYVDDPQMAAELLDQGGFHVLSEADLSL